MKHGGFSRIMVGAVASIALLRPAYAQPANTPDSAPAAAPTAPAGGASDAEVAALIAQANEVTQKSDAPGLQLYGFADFTFLSMFHDDPGFRTVGGQMSPTFGIGHLNLYAASELGGGFKTLFEIRFMYLPNGAFDLTAPGGRTNTAVYDPANAGKPLHWGSIAIQRAYLEYEVSSLLSIRAGQYLTPYGIWNVEHGTPNIIPVVAPFLIGESIFPTQQTGLQAFGTVPIGESTFGYHATVSNGRGSFDSYQDHDKNKALGGRLFLSTNPLGTSLTVGASGYIGKSTEANVDGVVNPDGSFELGDKLTTQFDELCYAGDALWTWGALRVQAEVAVNEVKYTEGHRPTPTYPSGVPGVVPDHRRWGTYGLVAYRLPWFTLMPYVLAGYLDTGVKVGQPDTLTSGHTVNLAAGLNLRPTSAVTFKLEYDHGSVHRESLQSQSADSFAASAAWSF